MSQENSNFKKRLFTAFFRTNPDFYIIGAQKGGTTSLYNYLAQHPQVLPTLVKEIHYYDFNFDKSKWWNRAHYPTIFEKIIRLSKIRKRVITGEASPYYIFHPLVPSRIANATPQAKLIILLRNPVTRAYSHYKHCVRIGVEPLATFEEALAVEQERTSLEYDKILENPLYYSYSHQHHTYMRRGIYVEQIKRWFDYFPREQILIMSSEQFYEQSSQSFQSILKFLGLSPWEPNQYDVFNSGGGYNRMNPETYQFLKEYYRPYNEELFKLVGYRFDWE